MDLYYGDLGYSTCVTQATKTKDLKLKFFPSSWGGGGGFSAQFSGIIFLALNYTLGTNFVPNVLKKVLSVTRLMRYRPIKIIS